MLRTITIALLLTAVSGAAWAGDKPQCKGSPKVVGDCFTLYGSLAVYSNSPSIRIWPYGTKKLYGVEDTDGNPETVALPDNLKEALASHPREIGGKYEMCPLDVERPNKLRPVCLESASRLKPISNDGTPQTGASAQPSGPKPQ